jgi:hypothetical protein
MLSKALSSGQTIQEFEKVVLLGKIASWLMLVLLLVNVLTLVFNAQLVRAATI